MKIKLLSSIAIIALMGLVSCNNSGKNKVQATEAQTAAKSEGGEKLIVDTQLSAIHWHGFKPGGHHHGTLALKQGELIIDGTQLKAGNFTIDMGSIVCDDLTDIDMNAKLVGHLESPDFFDVAKFPVGNFTITNAEEIKGNDTVNYRISGNLELKGISKNITFNTRITKEEGIYKAMTTEFTINRTDWGVNYGSKNVFKNLKDKFINDDIEISLVIIASAV